VNRYIIIPTRSWDGPAVKLAKRVASAGLPIIVAPGNPDRSVRHAIRLRKTRSSFGGWINEAAEHALTISGDARVVALNDDLDIDAASVTRMFDALESADIVIEPGRGDLHTPSRLTGHLFGFRPDKGLRLPEVDGLALWWWNTDHFYWDAITRGFTVEAVDGVYFDHVSVNDNHDGHWHYPDEFAWSVQADHDWFWSQHHALDEAHEGCYLTWWPDALPEGQTHRTEWS